jgi:activator of 2-hydroxyglutaryl-CoA dehydratase
LQIYNKISLNLNLKKIILFILFLKKNKIIRQTNFFFFLFSNLLKKNINFYFILFFLSYSYNNFKKNKNKNFFLKKKKYKKFKRLKNKKFHYKKNKNLLNFIKNTSYFFIKKYYIKIFFNKFKSV